MSTRQILLPSPSHPILIDPTGARVVVSFGGRTVADSSRCLTLREAHYPAVVYVPLEDVDTSLLTRTDHQTYCPYKGECSYYSLTVGTRIAENAVWEYQTPYDAVTQIRGHVAFYPDRVDSIEQLGQAIDELPGLC